MAQRPLELRVDGDPSERVPLLLIDESQRSLAEAITAVTGRLRVIVAVGSAPSFEFSDASGVVPLDGALSEMRWTANSGWAFRLGPAESGAMFSSSAPSWVSPRVRIITRTQEGGSRELLHALPESDGASILIGRGLDNDIALVDRPVSRSHLRIDRHEGVYRVADLREAATESSRMPTTVDGRPIACGGAPVEVGDKTIVVCGKSVITFEYPVPMPNFERPPAHGARGEESASPMPVTPPAPRDAREGARGAKARDESLGRARPARVRASWAGRCILAAGALLIAGSVLAIAWVCVSTG